MVAHDSGHKKHPVQIFLQLSKIVFALLVVLNLFMTVNSKNVIGLNPFNLIDICIWVYGYLSSLGYFKSIVNEDEDGVIEYETKVPFLACGILRIIEGGYYWFFSSANLNIKYFIILVVTDLLYTILLLIDKSSYYYMSMEDE